MKKRKKEREIVVEIPATAPSANRLWRGGNGRTYLSKDAVAFYNLVRACLSGRRAPESWKFYDVEIHISPTRRSGDVDNRIKPTLDALTHAGFWEDDKRVARVSADFSLPSKDGGTVVIIRGAVSKYPFIS